MNIDPSTATATIDELRRVPGLELDDSPQALAGHRSDRSAMIGRDDPWLVARPATTEQVSALLAYADQHRVPVVPQGARTGLAGGASATSGAILLDMSRMNRILRIDSDNGVAVAQPGVVIDDLAGAVAGRGLFYGPDPASSEWATLGGTVATNAGGMRCIKYGVTRDAVRSLEVVRADGTVMRTRPDTMKWVGGLDLTGLIVGSEGTLAVVTEVTVKLLPAPGPQRGVVALFPAVGQALAATNRIAAGPHTPSTLEFLDGVSLDGIRRYAPELGLPAEAGAWAVAVTDSRAGAEEDLASYEEAFTASGATSVHRAGTEAELHDALAARRLLNQGMHALLGGSLNGDVVVPRSQLSAFADQLGGLAAQYGALVCVAGHAGDGNLHPVVMFDPDKPGAAQRAADAMQAIWRLAQSLDGSLTGEHGVGLEKLPELGGELDAPTRELQRQIKHLFDPHGILNPGKKL